MNHDVTVLIPWVRREGMERAVASVCKQARVLTMEDVDRRGCPEMLASMVAMVSTPYICFLGDDCEASPDMIEAAIQANLKTTKSPSLVGLNDGVHGGRIATHWLAPRTLAQHLPYGRFFHPEYRHSYCDQELTEICRDAGRYIFAESARLVHHHPDLDKSLPDDEHRRRVKALLSDDFRTYRRRHKARVGWGKIAYAIRATYPQPAFVDSLMKMAGAFRPGDIYVPLSNRLPPANAANLLTARALSSYADTVLFLDDDMTFDGSTLNAMRDGSTEYDILSALAVTRRMPHQPICYVRMNDDETMTALTGDLLTGTQDVVCTGLAFTLVRRWVLEQLTRCYNGTPFDAHIRGEDFLFCQRALEHGAKVGVNCEVSVGHMLRVCGYVEAGSKRVRCDHAE